MALMIKLAKEVDGTSEVTLRDIETGDYIRLGPVMAPMIDAEGRRRMLEETKVRRNQGSKRLHHANQRLERLSDRQAGLAGLHADARLRDHSACFWSGLGRVDGESELLAFRHVALRTAYFWRMSPAELMKTSLPLLAVLVEEMGEMKEEIRESYGNP